MDVAKAYHQRLQRYLGREQHWIDHVIERSGTIRVVLKPTAPDYLHGKILFSHASYRGHEVHVRRSQP